MGSRIRCRKTVKKTFECYIVVEAPWMSTFSSVSSPRSSSISSENGHYDQQPKIKSIYPPTYKDEEILKSAIKFAFPSPLQSDNVEVFTFVLTQGDSKWLFGYCRHPMKSNYCSIYISFLHWQEIFYRTLNYCAELDAENLATFLQRMYTIPIPEAGTCLYVPMSKPFICPCPSDFQLPSIPENRNVSEFYNALTQDSMLKLFAALLSERRIVVVSKKLSRLSSIVITSNLFLFPMFWQHIFIPVLPLSLQDYLAAPMPFLIGVPLYVWDRIPPESLGQIVIVDADSDLVTSPFPEDLASMPEDIVSHLRKNLVGERVLGDGLSRAFLRALALLMGHYQDSIREDRTFDQELFIHFAHSSHRNFIETKLLRLQIFHQFIEERIEKLRLDNFESDEFEIESLAWKSRGMNKNGISSFSHNRKAIKNAGKAVMNSVKRESGNVIEIVKQNSALKSAFRSVKEGGKTVKQKGNIAYSDIKSKFHVPNPNQFGNILGFGGHSLAIKNGSNHRSKTHSMSNSQISAKPSSSGFHTSSSSLQIPNTSSSNIATATLRNSDDNLIHSASTSKLPSSITNNNNNQEGGVPKRLSRSEENLIDLDSPPAFSGETGFTLENPLYEFSNNDNVFKDKSDDQLLQEYGLDDYFSQINIGSSNSNNNNQNRNNINFNIGVNNVLSSNSLESSGSSNNDRKSGTNWTTFE